jgi:GDP-mannose transporter
MHREVASGVSFCVTSAAMTLLNKAALSSFHFTAPTTLLCFQCTLSLVLVVLAAAAGYSKLPQLSAELLLLWLPVNILFVGMVWSSFFALKYLTVAMVTVLKNLTSLLVICGDLYFFGKRYSAGVWATLVLMLVSALCSAATDLSFSVRGYTWQMVNNLFTAGYSLWLRGVMNRMSDMGRTHKGAGAVDEFSMVVYNNLLSIPMIAVIAAVSGEVGSLPSQPALRNRGFLIAALGSGAMGFLISVASMWFLSCTTATTFSLVGSLNKIPLAIIGMLLFKAPTSTNNLLSVFVGLIAGVVFAHAKANDATPASSRRQQQRPQAAVYMPQSPAKKRAPAWQQHQQLGSVDGMHEVPGVKPVLPVSSGR